MRPNQKNILACLGDSPIISIDKINRLCGTNVVVKLEKTNPGGSIKDRPAVYIIDYAERHGLLSPGGTIIESSSGNFGISLAMIGAAKDYRVIILVDPKTTETNIALMKAYGAEVIVVDQKDDSGSYHKTRIQLANELAMRIPGAYRPDQCFNVLSCFAHKQSTAQEIFDQTDGDIAGAVAAVSTGGQIGGLAEFFSEQSRKYVLAAVDAYGSTIFGGTAHAYKIPGVGLSWTPTNIADVNKIDFIYRIKDEMAFAAARVLCRNEGILVGVSSGAVLLAALALSRQLKNTQPLVAILGDSGERYLQTLFNDTWLNANDISTDTSLDSLTKLLDGLVCEQSSPTIINNDKPNLLRDLGVMPYTITDLRHVSETYYKPQLTLAS